VLHRRILDAEQLLAQRGLITVEVLSTWSVRRDRVHKMSAYSDARIAHYWLVAFDKAGAVTIEQYALAGGFRLRSSDVPGPSACPWSASELRRSASSSAPVWTGARTRKSVQASASTQVQHHLTAAPDTCKFLLGRKNYLGR
jgi:hypothetical protein